MPAEAAAARNADSRRPLIAAIFSSRLIVASAMLYAPAALASGASSYSLLFAIWRIDSIKVALNRKLWGEAGRLALHYGILAVLFPGFQMARRVLFPALFYPAFRMQDTMIKMTMGQRWWDKKKRKLGGLFSA